MTDTPRQPEGQEILAIVLDKPTRAEQVLLALAHLQGEGKVRMHDAVIVAKDAERPHPDRRDRRRRRRPRVPSPDRGSGCSAASWSAARPASPSSSAAPPPARSTASSSTEASRTTGCKQMADWIDPDSSALLLLVETGFDPEVIEELRRFEGTGEVAYTTLPAGAKADDRGGAVRRRAKWTRRPWVDRRPARPEWWADIDGMHEFFTWAARRGAGLPRRGQRPVGGHPPRRRHRRRAPQQRVLVAGLLPGDPGGRGVEHDRPGRSRPPGATPPREPALHPAGRARRRAFLRQADRRARRRRQRAGRARGRRRPRRASSRRGSPPTCSASPRTRWPE